MPRGQSLAELMTTAFNLSIDIGYPNGTKNGWKTDDLSAQDDDLVTGWADGLEHKYYQKRASGQCSLQATIDFDVAEFERKVKADIKRMESILTARKS